MEKQIFEIVLEAQQNNESMMEIIVRFEKLIQKYMYHFDVSDREDIKQQLQLAIIESIKKMTYVHSNGECVNFISQAVNNSFFNLCREHKKAAQSKLTEPDDFLLLNQPHIEKFSDIEMENDYAKKLATMPQIYKKIYVLLLEGYSDKEIAEKLHFSKQYINRLKKKLIVK